MKTKLYFLLTTLFFVFSTIFQSCEKDDNTITSVAFNGDATNGYVSTTATENVATLPTGLKLYKLSIKTGDNVVGYFEIVADSKATTLAGTYSISNNLTAVGLAKMGYYENFNNKGGCYIRQQDTKWYITSGSLKITDEGSGFLSYTATGLTAVSSLDGTQCKDVSINLTHVDGNIQYNYTYTETIVYPTKVPLLGTAMPGVERHSITILSGTTIAAYLDVIKPYPTTTAISNVTYAVTTWNAATTAEIIAGGYAVPAYFLTGGSYIVVGGVKRFLTSGNLTFALGLSNTLNITGTGVGTVLADGATTGVMDVSLISINAIKK